ncbi:hypothetical protein [Massilia agri]|uniref:Uncharacterized protein n=1 Tax=Massilia agri TaxID=1886785 RepID=A0ABT2AK53_9BURK|nr:hypothetical protein [Massilia agri]MCS0596622.1 hypothetical protein [Massilia agri]
MENTKSPKLSINGETFSDVLGVQIDAGTTNIQLSETAYIDLYPFNARMFAKASQRLNPERYVFEGPNLGIYCDTADPREGPYVNHFINRLEIHLQYLSPLTVLLEIAGSADLARSTIDPYWYRGASTGIWEFEASFIHEFPPIVRWP